MLNDSIVQVQGELASMKSEAADVISSAMSTTPVDGHGGSATAGDFASTMSAALHGVNDKDRAATDLMNAVDNGSSDDLVGAMLSSQQASLSFSMLMQVRNKVMGAVDDLVKLPI